MERARPPLAAARVRVAPEHFAALAPVLRGAAVVTLPNRRRMPRGLLLGKARQIPDRIGVEAVRLAPFPCHVEFSRSIPDAAPTVSSGRFRPRLGGLSSKKVSRSAIPRGGKPARENSLVPPLQQI